MYKRYCMYKTVAFGEVYFNFIWGIKFHLPIVRNIVNQSCSLAHVIYKIYINDHTQTHTHIYIIIYITTVVFNVIIYIVIINIIILLFYNWPCYYIFNGSYLNERK